MVTSRRVGIAAATAAAVVVLALAPTACKSKDEPDDTEVTDSTPESTGTFEDDVAQRGPALDGSWHVTVSGVCTGLSFNLTIPGMSGGNYAVFEPTPGHSDELTDLYALDDNGVAGASRWGGPGECDIPRRGKFFARPSTKPDILDVQWACTEEDGTLVSNQDFEYERGPCPETAAAGPGEVGGVEGGGETTTGGEAMSTSLGSDGTVTYGGGASGGGESEPGELCRPGESYLQYVAPPDVCARCEASCRQRCAVSATLLGNCRLCDPSPDGGTCGQCLKTCLFPE